MKKIIHSIIPNTAKLAIAIVIMILSMASFIASIQQAMAIEPVRNVTVTGDSITVGDIFPDIDHDAGFVLAPAPHPHKPITWNARTLNRIADAFNLNWRAAGSDQVTINRLATIIQMDDLKNVISTALKADGLTMPHELEIANRAEPIILPHEYGPALNVTQASYNPSRQSFSATIVTEDGATHTLTGVAHGVTNIPVLKTTVARGETITRNMVTALRVRDDLLTDDMVLRENDLIGMTPRRILRPGTPVEESELAKPVLVKRGDLVTMQLERGPIQITALAKALESGTKDDVIRVMNMDSKRTLEAQITGIREARVSF